jgi:hemoglobin-like flavoprotein
VLLAALAHSNMLSLFNRLFELEPRTKKVFHFDLNYNPTPQALKESGNLKFAIRMLESFDACISMLGPETEILYELLADIGRRHVSYGVSPHFFPFFGQAMVYALGNLLGDKWTPELEEVWLDLYDSFSGIMMKAILDVHLERLMPEFFDKNFSKKNLKDI